MPYLVGTDEAGYGPNLGPLVIGATRWSVPDLKTDLDQQLSAAICRKSTKPVDFPPLLMGDSKQVYKSGNIKTLELGVLSSVAAVFGELPNDSHELIRLVCGTEVPFLDDTFWLKGSAIKLPVKCDLELIKRQSGRLQETFDREHVTLDRLSARLVFPSQFNEEIDQLGNKATVLSAQTMDLLGGLIDDLGVADALHVFCDKHGGRNAYAPLLQAYLTDQPVRVECETKLVSRYRWQGRTIEFLCKGESHLPIALSSMLAKYLREVMMMSWNQFWQIKLPDLKPTKGYPQDAKRFKRDIESVQKELQISDHEIWRNR